MHKRRHRARRDASATKMRAPTMKPLRRFPVDQGNYPRLRKIEPRRRAVRRALALGRAREKGPRRGGPREIGGKRRRRAATAAEPASVLA